MQYLIKLHGYRENIWMPPMWISFVIYRAFVYLNYQNPTVKLIHSSVLNWNTLCHDLGPPNSFCILFVLNALLWQKKSQFVDELQFGIGHVAKCPGIWSSLLSFSLIFSCIWIVFKLRHSTLNIYSTIGSRSESSTSGEMTTVILVTWLHHSQLAQLLLLVLPLRFELAG